MKPDDKEKLVNYRIHKARETLREVDFHIKSELWNTSVNRLYYACYYAVNALLVRYEIKTKTHAGVRLMLGLHFIKTGLMSHESGRFYSKLFDKRLTGDYDDFMDHTKEEVMELIAPAHEFISEIEKLLKNKK
jgi:uncharacterized protein (UPF0332 family)